MSNKMEYRVQNTEYRPIYWLVLLICLLITSCSSEAVWEKEGVEVTMKINSVSAGFADCSFSTNKDAYYLIAICEPWEDFNPMYNSKQFMQLALDSAYAEYLQWRNDLLKGGEFNVAPFSSHSLQYGSLNHFFTGLLPGMDYWVYAFPVNPETMQPIGKLVLENITTTKESIYDVHFEYRVKGEWDYVYPVDSTGAIYPRFPYIATTRDSAELGMNEEDAVLYFIRWCLDRFVTPDSANVLYGVQAVKNDGIHSYTSFKENHTYYTIICGYDGSFKQTTVYKFQWKPDCNYYFVDTDSANIANNYR